MIDRRLDLVELFVNHHEIRRTFHETHLRGVHDLQRISKKFVAKKATLQDMYKTFQTVQRLPKMLNLLADNEDLAGQSTVNEHFITPLRENIEDFEKYLELVEATIDLDYFESHREFRVRPEFDDELAEKREQLDQLDDKANKLLNRCMSDLGTDTVKLDISSQNGYLFRLTLKEEKSLRGQSTYKIVSSTKGQGVHFSDKKLGCLSDEYLEIAKDYEKKQRKLVEQIVEIASGYSQPMQDLATLLANIDVYVALATSAVSAPIPYVRPKLLPMGSGKINLQGVRHPCVEMQNSTSSFISNDIIFNKGDDGPSFYIITGPNMGGKSTFLRSVALTSLMAQMGSFVACDEAEMAVVDAVLARIGASDNICRGVSTFMAEMLDTSVILKLATSNSLVIIDELGRGTSTYDGFGLAWAVSEHLVNVTQCYCLFATHFHELTRLESEYRKQVANLHVSTHCDEKSNLTFLYKLKPGNYWSILVDTFQLNNIFLLHQGLAEKVSVFKWQKWSSFQKKYWQVPVNGQAAFKHLTMSSQLPVLLLIR